MESRNFVFEEQRKSRSWGAGEMEEKGRVCLFNVKLLEHTPGVKGEE